MALTSDCAVWQTVGFGQKIKKILELRSHYSQVVMDGTASVDVESLQELCETLTPGKSSCQATDQLRESDEEQESSDTVLPSDL